MAENLSKEFEELYNENYLKVYRLALSLTGNEGDAEEITQESFFKAFQNYDGFRGESSFFTWIYRITLNVSKDYMRYKSKMPIYSLTEDYGYSLEDIIDDNPDVDPEITALAKEAKYMCLHCMLECLPEEQRRIFCLSITLGLPQKVVAEIMECSISKVKTTLHRAKQRWFGYMDNRCSFIKKSNPCRCQQWVKFGLKQGWITGKLKDDKENLDVHMKAISEVRSLRALRDVYMHLYPENQDESLSERIKTGIKNKEWKNIL